VSVKCSRVVVLLQFECVADRQLPNRAGRALDRRRLSRGADDGEVTSIGEAEIK